MKIDYLPSGSKDCPLVRLFDFNEKDADGLRRTLESLADGNVQRVVLTESPDFTAVDDCELILITSRKERGIVSIGDPKTFECHLSQGRWETMAGLVETFCMSSQPGHYQWLDRTSKTALLLSTDGSW